MKLDQFVIGIVIFGLIIFVGTQMIGDANVTYNISINESEYSDVYDTIDDAYELSDSMKESSVEGDIDDEESWESMTKGSYSAVRQVITTPVTLMGQIMEALGQKLGIHPVIIKVGLIILSLTIIFSIIYLFMRFKP